MGSHSINREFCVKKKFFKESITQKEDSKSFSKLTESVLRSLLTISTTNYFIRPCEYGDLKIKDRMATLKLTCTSFRCLAREFFSQTERRIFGFPDINICFSASWKLLSTLHYHIEFCFCMLCLQCVNLFMFSNTKQKYYKRIAKVVYKELPLITTNDILSGKFPSYHG